MIFDLISLLTDPEMAARPAFSGHSLPNARRGHDMQHTTMSATLRHARKRPSFLSEDHQALPLVVRTFLRFWTASASSASTFSVSSQPMHASVMLTPYFKPSLPSFGTFWAPVKRQKKRTTYTNCLYDTHPH